MSEPISQVVEVGPQSLRDPIPIMITLPETASSESSISSNPIINIIQNKYVRKLMQSLVIVSSLVSLVILAVFDCKKETTTTTTTTSSTSTANSSQ